MCRRIAGVYAGIGHSFLVAAKGAVAVKAMVVGLCTAQAAAGEVEADGVGFGRGQELAGEGGGVVATA